MTGYRYWSPKRYGQQILFILLFPIIPIIKKTNIRPIIPNIRFSCQIFGQLFRLFIFLLFHKPCRFYRLSEYSSDYSFFYFFYVIYINNNTIVLHPIPLHLIFSTDIVIKDLGEKIGIRSLQGAAGSRALDTDFFDLEGEARGVGL